MLYEQKKGTLVNARYSLVFLLFFTPSFASITSTTTIIPFEFDLSGYIKGEAYSDSRQTFAPLVEDLSFFPRKQRIDPTGHDINARGQVQMDAYESRIRLGMKGPDYKSMIIEGVIELDFEIFTKTIVNIPEMRHAFGKIETKNASLVFGHTWHPIVFIESQTINYNGSTPYDYYARAPLLIFTYRAPRRVDIITSVTMQEDYASDGPQGAVNQYMRWATVPNLHLQVRHLFGEHMVGAGADWQRIAPRIVSDTGFKIYERISSGVGFAYLQLIWPSWKIYAKINGGQNAFNYGGLGGYAVQQNSTNPVTGQRKYTSINNIAGWFDLSFTKDPNIIPGMFFGFSKNLGPRKKIERNVLDENGMVIIQNIFAFGADIDETARISCRLTGKFKSFVFAGEVEYTRANYGDTTNSGSVVNIDPAECIRCTVASYYYF